jgi:alkane 1-monooxygenase
MSLYYLLPHTFPIILLIDIYILPEYLGKYLLPVIKIFIILPYIDTFILGKNYINIIYTKDHDNYYNFALYSYVFLDIICFVLTIFYVSSNNLSFISLIYIAWSLSVITGAIGITVAHELHHRYTINILKKNHTINILKKNHNKNIINYVQLYFDLMLSEICLGMVSYNHFNIFHSKIHHRYVATVLDTSYVSIDTNTYYHMIYSYIKTYHRCLYIDSNGNNIKSWIPNKLMMIYTILYIMIPYMIYKYLGNDTLYVYIIQSVLSIGYFENINMIQHFGLTRLLNETVTELHSWNSYHWLTNYYLFQLPRHSDHHTNSTIKYPYLKTNKNTYTLPYNYQIMMIYSLISPNKFQKFMKNEIRKKNEN